MHPIELAINTFLEQACKDPVDIPEEIVEEFGEVCKQALRKHFIEPRDKTFRLRMSNIGRDIRQLQLDQKFGPPPMTKDFLLRVFHGDLLEAFVLFLLRASEVDVVAHNKPVSLEIADTKVDGTLDFVIKVAGEYQVYDAKSASRWAAENKFKDINTVETKDDFGYIPQLHGYADAEKIRAGGFIVVNKDTTEIKVIATDPLDTNYNRQRDKARAKMLQTVTHIKENRPIPPCPGVEAETFNGKLTGNIIVNDLCRFCPHKATGNCHKGATYEKDRNSKAVNPRYKYYLPCPTK